MRDVVGVSGEMTKLLEAARLVFIVVHKFGNFRGENPRAWLLKIVRNTFYNSLRKNRSEKIEELDDEALSIEDTTVNAEILNSRISDAEVIRSAIAALPVQFREIVVLREME